MKHTFGSAKNTPSKPMKQIRLSIKKRLILLTTLAFFGGACFVPFVIANAPVSQNLSVFPIWIAFTIGPMVVTLLCSWCGLRISDKLNLSMPILRSWEKGLFPPKNQIIRILIISIVSGVLFGIIAATLSNWLSIPDNQGNLFERISTTLFAAIVPEVFVHLFVMSGLILLLKRVWLALLLSSLLFAVLHGSPGDVGITISIFVYGFNFVFAYLTGWLYAKYGFESAVLSHAAGHIIVLGIN